jgi:hypothetical protein
MADMLSPADERPASDPSLARVTAPLAARSLYLASGTTVASMVAISLFFAGAGGFWGPVNDLLVVATVLLLLPTMAVLVRLDGDRPGRWFRLVTLAAAGGVVVIALGQLALVVGLITLDASFLTGGMGVLPVIAWVGATGALALRTPLLGRAVAVWAAAFLVLIGVTVVVLAVFTTDTPTLTGVLGGPLVVVLLGWMVSLARDLARTSGA